MREHRIGVRVLAHNLALLVRPATAVALLGLVLVSLSETSADETSLPFIARSPHGNYVVPGALGDIVYKRIDGRELALDAYVQRGGGPRPLALVVHGGAWTSGSRVSFVGQLLETLTDAGFNWVSVDYRLGGVGRYADAVDDLSAAVSFVRRHAQALGADPDRLVLIGEDAGAHLSALLAARRPAGLAATVLIGGYYDLRSLKLESTEPSLPREASPLFATGLPGGPVLAVHGSGDTEAPTADVAAYCDRLRQGGVPCERLIVSGASHRAENWWPRQWGYKQRLVEWLVAKVGEPGPHTPHTAGLKKRVVFDRAERLALDLWVPESRAAVPLVLIAHGGGWEAGDRVTYVTPLFEPLARAGFAWASIDYRLTPQVQHPAQLDDLRNAIAFVRANASAWHVDPGRIVLLGESASAQMALLVGADDPDLAGVVSFYGVYDLAAMVTDASPRSLLRRLFGRTVLDEEARRVLRAYSPIHRVRQGSPPVLLVHGTNERLWEQGVAMKAALDRARVPSELVALEGAPHGMENWEGVPRWENDYKARLIAWLHRLPRNVGARHAVP